MSTQLVQPLAPPPPPVIVMSQQANGASSEHGSVGPVIAVLAVIAILGVLAGMVGRLCSGRSVMGFGHFDVEGWIETKCATCLDGRVEHPRRMPPRSVVVGPVTEAATVNVLPRRDDRIVGADSAEPVVVPPAAESGREAPVEAAARADEELEEEEEEEDEECECDGDGHESHDSYARHNSHDEVDGQQRQHQQRHHHHHPAMAS